MNRRTSYLTTPLLLTAVIGLFGCSGESSPAPGSGTPVSDSGDKEGEGHDHAADHVEVGPHHGHLIELGEGEYHAELTHDDATKTVTVYLLDKGAKSPVAIPDPEIVLNLTVDGKPLQAKLTANPQAGDPEGQSSRFSITDETVLEVHDAPKTTGRLNVTIYGKTYMGTVKPHAHGDHTHRSSIWVEPVEGRSKPLRVHIRGAEGAEVVVILKREIGPGVGGEERHSFECVKQRMFIFGGMPAMPLRGDRCGRARWDAG